jgi:hypothetical protein
VNYKILVLEEAEEISDQLLCLIISILSSILLSASQFCAIVNIAFEVLFAKRDFTISCASQIPAKRADLASPCSPLFFLPFSCSIEI